MYFDYIILLNIITIIIYLCVFSIFGQYRKDQLTPVQIEGSDELVNIYSSSNVVRKSIFFLFIEFNY